MSIRFLIELACDGCGECFKAESKGLFTSVSEADEQAFRAGWEKTSFHGIVIYACPVCQESAKKAAA